MQKVPLSTRVEKDIADRLKRIAVVDNRDLSNVLDMCVKIALPILEADVAAKPSLQTLRDEASKVVPAGPPQPEIKYRRSKKH